MAQIKKAKTKTISEEKVIDAVLKWAYRNRYGLRPKIKQGHKSGVDLELTHEKTRHKYLIECKGGPHHEVNFVFALGQIITRMTRKPLTTGGQLRHCLADASSGNC